MEPLIALVIAIVVTLAVAWIILWAFRRFGTPADLYSVIEIVVWVIAGGYCLIRVLRFAGIY